MIVSASGEESGGRRRAFGFRRMILVYGLVLTLTALIVMVFLMLHNDWRTFRRAIIRRVDVEANLIAEVSTAALRFDDRPGLQEILTGMCRHMVVDSVAVYDLSGRVFAFYQKPGGQNIPEHPPEQPLIEDKWHVTIVRPIMLYGESIGTVVITRSLEELYGRSIRSILVAVLMLAGSLVVAFVASDRIRVAITGPVDNLIRTARAISSTGDYSVRAPAPRVGELRELTTAFNDMLAEAEAHRAQMEQVTRDLQAQVLQRIEAEKELSAYQEELEQRVKERTEELSARMNEAELLNKAMVNLLEDLQDTNRRLEVTMQKLETSNEELEAFSYSVSHDLRAPLRGIDGFSKAIIEDYGEVLDEKGKDYLDRVRKATQRMGHLIDDMLKLSRISRQDLRVERVDLTHLADDVIEQFRASEPDRAVLFKRDVGIVAWGDRSLLRIVLENLLGNAWKFTGNRSDAQLEFGCAEKGGKETVYYVRDNGAGFDMKYAGRLFAAFQRLHKASEFGGTGVGLTTVRRIIHRHGGRVWAEGKENKGATFFFTLK
ncbi:MAG: HAMP domain-containing protein [Verrucomicrobia bacterium]|nr:HAMP domain-containing protein [Verrucomicrobiota bacterium]